MSIAPSLCTRWLIPRLGRFCEEHPHVEVRIDATSRLADFTNGTVDLAIRYVAKRYTDLHYESLFIDEAFPVCSPAVSERLGADPRRLGQTLLLHWSSHDQWDRWFAHAGVSAPDRSKGLFFSHLMLALDAAQSDQGVALASMPLARYDLEAGRLVRPFGPTVDTGYEYVVVGRPGAFRQAKVQAFTAWVVTEARAIESLPARRAHRTPSRAAASASIGIS